MPGKRRRDRTMLKGNPDRLTREELKRVIQTACGRAQDERGFRDYVLIRMLAYTGARITEVLNLRWNDFERDKRGWKVIIRTINGRNAQDVYRAVPIPDDLAQDVFRLRELGWMRPLPLSRGRAFNIVRDILLDAGIDSERAFPHIFRHTFAYFCIEAGIPPAMLARLLGHRSLHATMAYYNNINGNDLRSYVERLWVESS